MLTITSLQNPRVKALVKLRERRERDRAGQFLVEGYRAVRRALANAWPLTTLFICPRYFLGDNDQALVQQAADSGAEIVELAPEVFAKCSYRDRPDGLLALAPQRSLDLATCEPGAAPLLVVAEAIEKPGNLGTMLRSADAAAVDAMIVCDPTTDVYNPNVVRASIGTLFTVPLHRAASAEFLAWARARGIRLVAATPHTDTLHTQADLTGPIAILMGTEQYGLSPTFMAAADVQVRLPMLGQADSLNVATATTLLLYEAQRQRRGW